MIAETERRKIFIISMYFSSDQVINQDYFFLELHENILRAVKKYSVNNLQIKTTNVRKILYGSIWSHMVICDHNF